MARKNEKTESSKERFVAVRKNNEGNQMCIRDSYFRRRNDGKH